MKPFTYIVARSVQEAVAALREHGAGRPRPCRGD